MLRRTNALFYLLKRKSGTTIYCRITVNKEQKARSTGQKVEEKYWNQDTQRVEDSYPQSESVNETLSVIENQVREAENTLISRHEPVTLQSVLDIIDEGVTTVTLLELFYEHNKNLKELIGIDVTEATYNRYRCIENHIRKFLKWNYDKEDVYMSELDLDFVKDLERFFKTEQDISHNTTNKYMTYTKKITNIAVGRGYLRGDPFNGYKARKKEKDPTHLTLKELRTLETKSFHAERIQRVTDVFVFGCYTGLSYADLAGLDYSDFYEDKDGDLWLRQARQKTEEPAQVLITSKPKAILDKYEDWDSPLPVISNQKMNSYLKEIGDFCGFDKELHCHVSRHTFATTVTLEMGLPLETVQRMLGHKQRKQTEHYARVTNRKLSADQKVWREQLAEYGVG